MSKPSGLVLVASMLLLSLAGCSGGKATAEPSNGADVVATSDAVTDAGSLAGTVTNDALEAISGAQVSLLELKATATTGSAGEFRISNVPPGTYKFAAAALGYESVAKQVVVLANSETTASVVLASIAIEEAGSHVIGPISGYFECRLGYRIPAYGASTGACPAVPAPNDKSSVEFKMQNNTKAFVGEMRWSQGSFATSQRLRLSFSYVGRASTHWWCTATSKSPITFTYQVSADDEGECLAPTYCGIAKTSASALPSTKDKLLVYTNTPFGCEDTDNMNPVELAYQQRFEIVVTTFQSSLPPEHYSAFPDA